MVLKSTPQGQKFVDLYYAVSPIIVSFCQSYPIFGFFFKGATAPFLMILAYLVRRPFLWPLIPRGKVIRSNIFILR